ncbi:MAG: hypothetical protein NC418_08070 [Muribaculaceae bacterium]|nr:hypothetical protein [Muribaculaceae bacterium]
MKITDTLRNTRLALALLMCMALTWVAAGCHDNDVWNDVPEQIGEFINHYFPYSELSSCTETDAGYHIRIDDGPGLSFDRSYAWTSIDGYGMPLPQVLLFDQLPPALYDYIQETENLNGVFSMERDSTAYVVTLLDTSVRYIIETGEMTTRL